MAKAPIKPIMKFTTFVLCLFGFLVQTSAQSENPSPILFIYDASGSMWGPMDGKTKKEIAADVLSNVVSGLPEQQNVGLMAYGHRKKGDCRDVEFLLDLNNASKAKVSSMVKGINPLGKTPLAYSAKLAINNLKQSGIRATIILITDGIESCDGNLCEVIKDARAEGIDFKLHIIGFGLKDGEKEQLRCAATAGDGTYFDADSAGGLGEVLTEATSETIDDPAGNLSIYADKNGEPVDAWIKARQVGSAKDTDAGRTYRDTAWVYLPPGKYTIAIKPLEGTDIPGTSITVEMKEGERLHRDISFDGGKLQVTATNNGEGWDAMVKMYDKNTGKVIAQTRTYGRDKNMEVPAGNYKVSFEALKIKGANTYFEIDNVEVSGNNTTPLSHNFESGIAMIGVKTKDGEFIDAIVKFKEINAGKNVASGRTYTSSNNNPKKFLLNPGTYTVDIATLGKHKGDKESIQVIVKKGETIEKNITF